MPETRATGARTENEAMRTGTYKPEDNNYPGVFIQGLDALKWAECFDLVSIALTEKGEDLTRFGFSAKSELMRLQEVLRECKV